MELQSEISYNEFTQIIGDCFPEEDLDIEVFQNNLSKDQFLFVKQNNVVRGYLLFDLSSNPAILIQLCISKGFRNSGIGSFLMGHLKQKLIDHDVSEMVLNVDFDNHNAIKFYEKHGFTKKHTNTQFSYEPKDVGKINPSTLKLVQLHNPELIRDKMEVGQFMSEYISQSSHLLVYSILDDNEKLRGYFMYNPDLLKVTHLSIYDASIVNEFMIHLSHLIPTDSELLIESFNHDIDLVMKNVTGISIKYKLQIMRYIEDR